MSTRVKGAAGVRRVLLTVLHGVALMWWLRVWIWHLSPQAGRLPGASGFGWFYKYMTFWGYSLQIVTFAACLLDDIRAIRRLSKISDSSGDSRKPSFSDDLACMSFAFAHVVTIMFHVVQATTKNGVHEEGVGALRPFWLCPSIHKLNSLVAWIDLLLSQPKRQFSNRARICCCCLAVTYTGFILLCKEINGRFPYPFLNKLPFPSGFLFIVGSSVAVFTLFFQIGSVMNSIIGSLLTRGKNNDSGLAVGLHHRKND